ALLSKMNSSSKARKSATQNAPVPPKLPSGLKPHLPIAPPAPMPEPELPNGVTRISPDGSVATIFSGEDMVMSLLWHKGPHGDELLIGTGVDGKIFAFSPDDESETLVARIKEESVTNLAADKDGNVYIGASDLGQFYTLAPNLAAKGTY